MGDKRIRVAVLAALFTGAFAAAQLASRYHLTQRRQPNWVVVPYQVNDWSGFDSAFDPIYGADPSDSRLLRIYHRGPNPPVILYVGFFGELATILDVHTPEVCYPAEGWKVLKYGATSGEIFRGKETLARQIIADKTGNQRLVVWWYIAGPRPIATRIRYIYAMLAMSSFTGRTDGSIIRLETPVNEDGEMAAQKRIHDFQQAIIPALDKALPL